MTDSNQCICNGLITTPQFITDEEAKSIIQWMDTQQWLRLMNTPNSRKVQQYGYIYQYGSRNLGPKVAPIPEHYLNLFARLNRGWIPEQLIINNYQCGQRISAHIDSKIFGPEIVTITLGSPTIMRLKYQDLKIDLNTTPNAAIILTGDSRYKWTHETLHLRGQDERRISLTFRTLAKDSVDAK